MEIRLQIKGEQPEIVVRQTGVEIPGMDQVQNRRVCWIETAVDDGWLSRLFRINRFNDEHRTA